MTTPTASRHRAAAGTAQSSAVDQSSERRDGVTLGTGRTPTAALAAAPLAVLVALLVLAAGVVGIRDALVAAGALSGSSWITSAAGTVDGLRAQPWMIPVGVVVAVIGLWWVLAALKPRKRTELELAARTGSWIRPDDVARLARTVADEVDGVVSASASAKRRSVTVTVTTTSRESSAIRAEVTEAVQARLAPLTAPPTVKVKARYVGET